MGMYTELIFGAALKESTPDNVINIIKKMVDRNLNIDVELPNHVFFNTKWGSSIMRMTSYYFPGTHSPTFWKDDISKLWYLHFRSNIKNYDNEIDKFLDWIKPYIIKGSGRRNFYAIVTYEESEIPTIYYLNEDEYDET